jgi:hypothetical protein
MKVDRLERRQTFRTLHEIVLVSQHSDFILPTYGVDGLALVIPVIATVRLPHSCDSRVGDIDAQGRKGVGSTMNVGQIRPGSQIVEDKGIVSRELSDLCLLAKGRKGRMGGRREGIRVR